MQTVIDIPDHIYNILKDDKSLISNVDHLAIVFKELVKKGTPLPKGHGKIIDVDQFYKAFNEHLSERKSFSFADLETILNVVTPPILKTNKEVENADSN